MSLRRGVWHLAREYLGVAEAGGVKDMVAGLAESLAGQGVSTSVSLPCYGFVDWKRLGAVAEAELTLEMPARPDASPPREEPVTVYSLERKGVRIYLLASPRTLEKRNVYVYTAADQAEDPRKVRGTGHWDAHHLNLILQRGTLELALRLGRQPDVFHCHDGHAAFLPALTREIPRYRQSFAQTRSVVTIHNAGRGYHQEIHDPAFAGQLTGLPLGVLSRGFLNRTVDPLVLGALYGRVTTVSEGYAREIASGKLEELTGGLGAAFRRARVRLLGITNGIDPRPYDPRDSRQSGLPARFDPSRGDLAGKRECRRVLTEAVAAAASGERLPGGASLEGLSVHGRLCPDLRRPLYTFVGRLTEQKGLDVLVPAVGELLAGSTDARFLLLGQGDRGIEEALLELCRRDSGGRLAVMIGFSPEAARLLFAAGDFFLVPSRYEPCGLTDFYAQMMGNIPIVHLVGGLRKVRPGETGYGFTEYSSRALAGQIHRSLEDHRSRPDLLEEIRRRAFREIYERHTWERVVRQSYLPLYEEAWARKPASR